MEPETLAAIAALTVSLSAASAAYAYTKNAARKLDEARAAMLVKVKGRRFHTPSSVTGVHKDHSTGRWAVAKARPQIDVSIEATPPRVK